MKRNVLFRVDASSSIGSGHMIRCLVLAECLRQRGFRIGFVCRAHHNHRNHLVTERGFRLHQLETSDSSVERTASSSSTWLDVTWEVDAWQTIEACKAYGHLYGLIVDHYGLDYRWEKMLRPYMNRIMVIDDLADRNHDCDVLLDQNLYDDMESRYSGHVPGECKLLLGPAFALLHPEYRRLHKTILPRTRIKRILVFFGAVDPQDLTSMAVEAILSEGSNVQIDVVLSKSSPNYYRVERMAGDNNRLKLYSDQPCLAEFMARADLSIGACGTTSLERCCSGLPSLVVTVADNQVAVAESLHKRRLIHWLGRAEDMNTRIMREEIKKILGSDDLESWSRRCLNLVDGFGTIRVMQQWLNCLPDQLVARKAKREDEPVLLQWANDLAVRKQSFSSGKISAEDHHEWYQEILMNPERRKIFIIENVDHDAIGQVRFEYESESWRMSYSMAAPYRGLGLARRMLDVAIEQFLPEVGPCMVFGEVKPANKASRQLLKSLGFSEQYIRQHGHMRYEKHFL